MLSDSCSEIPRGGGIPSLLVLTAVLDGLVDYSWRIRGIPVEHPWKQPVERTSKRRKKKKKENRPRCPIIPL